MAPFHAAGLFLLALASPCDGARFSHTKAQEELATVVDMKSGLWLTESCQDYPEDLGMGLGDTVRIYKKGDRQNNKVGLVGCQDPEQQGKVCLDGGKGCWNPDELRPVNTFIFAFHTIGNAASQIFTAVADDVFEAWKDIKMSLGFFASQAGAKISYISNEVATTLNVCDEDARAATAAKFGYAFAAIKSRLDLVVDFSVERWQDAKENIKSVAEGTKASIVKMTNYLSTQAGDAYTAHLKPIVDALGVYLSGIAGAVTNVPDELNPVPDGLVDAIDNFANKMADLCGKMAEVAKNAYESLAMHLSSLQASVGRLVAAASQRWREVKEAVKKGVSKAVGTVKQWSGDALKAVCNFSLKDSAASAFEAVKAKFQQAVDAVKFGLNYVKETLMDVAAGIAATVEMVATSIKNTAVKLWESEAVQGALAAIREEIRVLKELIKEQAGLVQQIVGGLFSYMRRFIPKWIQNKMKTAGQKAQELAVKVRDEIKELMGLATDGETEDVETDDDTLSDE
jgi:phage-related protein